MIGLPGYRALELLSRGRAFEVWDAWSEERRCRCVAKTVLDERLDDASARRRLEAEARLLRRLAHPHVVRAYEFVAEPRPVAILETLTGATLAHLIDTEGPLRPAEVAVLGLQLVSAIDYLHRHGWLHLDLKPSNVVAEHGRAKLIDLSVARRPGRAPAGVGTWCYLAPEQAAGGELGPPADVWGIGVVLYEAATAEPAFDDPAVATGSNERPERFPVLHAARPSLRGRQLPRALVTAVEACLRRDPADRPPLDELWRLLEAVPGTPSLTATR